MNTYFVVSDVHSFYDEMMKALKKKGFEKDNPEHIFVSLGDLFDRGPKSRQCLNFVNSLPNERKILIRGNHEDLLVAAINRGYFKDYDYSNKTVDTCTNLTKMTLQAGQDIILRELENNKDLNNYLNSCIDYFESDNFVFVHGWIPFDFKNMKFNESWRNDNWEQARWENGFDAWYNGIIVPDKTIVCGHWNTSYAHSNFHNDGYENLYQVLTKAPNINISQLSLKQYNKLVNYKPFIDKGIIGLDACTVVSKKVNCLKLKEEE